MSDGNGSVPWYAVAFHESFGTMACVVFAKSCKEHQHKLADLMVVLLLSQLQARLLIFRSIWQFGFYDSDWYHENAGLGERLPGRWLGVSHRVGSLMLYFGFKSECGRLVPKYNIW